MAHFAQMQGKTVQHIVVIANAAINGGTFPDSEPMGQALLHEAGLAGNYLQCSFSGSFRGAFPGIGWQYDSALDSFIEPTNPEIMEEL